MNQSPPHNHSTVFLVDDDAATLDSLRWLLESDDLRVAACGSPRDLLNVCDPQVPGCLVVDVLMPGMSGLELQEELQQRGCRQPIIFVTGHGDVPTCSRAYRNGAFDFIEKPIDDRTLVDVVQRAIGADADRRARHASQPEINGRLALLTPREQEVMDLLVEGKSVKQIAVELGVGFPTAARHRSRVLEKMQVHNDVELVRLVLASDFYDTIGRPVRVHAERVSHNAQPFGADKPE